MKEIKYQQKNVRQLVDKTIGLPKPPKEAMFSYQLGRDRGF